MTRKQRRTVGAGMAAAAVAAVVAVTIFQPPVEVRYEDGAADQAETSVAFDVSPQWAGWAYRLPSRTVLVEGGPTNIRTDELSTVPVGWGCVTVRGRARWVDRAAHAEHGYSDPSNERTVGECLSPAPPVIPVPEPSQKVTLLGGLLVMRLLYRKRHRRDAWTPTTPTTT